ncbi:EAL domain-containing protein [Gallaecimonas sp. GXIMD4217]|uniref:putative bifunctional diguanylate cyclase/phosphodiesterase n=1 Tax=Gallaecimonas sp. GXIMD4217 TaxID=3131927 RepID=UPI00311ABA91
MKDHQDSTSALLNMLQIMASALSTLSGREFFVGMANLLYVQSGADYVIIGECQQPGEIRTRALLKDGQPLPNMDYRLAGTPCEGLMEGHCCCYRQGVAEQFPQDQMLADLGVDSYIGRALHDNDGKPLGLIALLYRHPKEQSQLLAQMLDLCASRTGAELERQAQIRHLKYLSEHDPLTGLYNRTRLNKAVERIEDNGALLLLDLNHFKDINDTLGHGTGDRLLVAVADRLKALGDDQRIEVYRLGGDEFAILLLEPGSPVELCERIGQQLARTFRVDGIDLSVGASIGIARVPDHGRDLEPLLRCADVAMYGAKHSGRLWQCYDPKQDGNSPQRLALLHGIKGALSGGQFQLVYQPKLALADQRLVGVEALLRWHHPVQGEIPPGRFIPLLEQTEHIRELSLWVMEAALRQIRLWHEQGLVIPVAINLSGANLGDNSFVFRAMKLLDGAPQWARHLEVEITETAFITNRERADWILRQLRGRGVSIAIDDFGTGYSSLSYLHRLPLDRLKVDRSFILNMEEDDQARAIVQTIIDLAHGVGLEVVAEGIEKPEVAQALYEMGADQAQGFLYGRPMAPAVLRAWQMRREKNRARRAR